MPQCCKAGESIGPIAIGLEGGEIQSYLTLGFVKDVGVVGLDHISDQGSRVEGFCLTE